MKKVWILVPVAMICLWATAAQAQSGGDESGCSDSPENPTLVLAAVGTAGASLAAMRNRLRASRAKKKRTVASSVAMAVRG